MKVLKFFLILTFTINLTFATEFPLREKFPKTSPITLRDLENEYGKVTILDVRSNFEYNVIHIKGSKNIPLTKDKFLPNLKKAVGGDKSTKIVTYCNGKTCAKSYKAAFQAQKNGFTNVKVFDEGIFAWAMANANKSVLLGTSPLDRSKIIPRSKLNKRMLEKDAFSKAAVEKDAYLIDARDPTQRSKTPDFAKNAENLPFDKLTKLFNDSNFKKKIDGKTLYIFDAVGKQVRWLQYHLEESEIKKYYFLKEGAWSFFGTSGANK